MGGLETFLLAVIVLSTRISPVYLMSWYVPVTTTEVVWQTWLNETPHTTLFKKPDLACALQCELQHDLPGGKDWCNAFRTTPNNSDSCELSSLRPEAIDLTDNTAVSEGEKVYFSPSRKHAGKAFFSIINGHQLALFTEGGKVPCVVSPDVIPEIPGDYVIHSSPYMGFTSKTRTLIICGGRVGAPGARFYTDKCYFIQLDHEVPSWNDSLSLPYKWDSGASVSTGSRVFFWGGGLGPKDPVFVFDSRELTIKTLLGEDGSPIQALHDTSRGGCAMALDDENLILVVGRNHRESYQRAFHLHVSEDWENEHPIIKELAQLESTRISSTCGVVDWFGRKTLMVGGNKNGSSSPTDTMEIMDATNLDSWTTLTIPYPHDPFYRLTNMGSHGKVAMMTKDKINFLNPDTMSWEEDPGVQLGGIYNLYSIEVVDQQYFPTCFIDEAL